MPRRRILIMGAAGRDFHNFNTVYRQDRSSEVVAFTATQIPNIEGRRYPAALAGRLYPRGIPIFPESDLPKLIRRRQIDEVVFAYSDVSFDSVMSKGSVAMAAGADFKLLGPESTMVRSRRPVIAVVAVRTGCGKSQTSREVCRALRRRGLRVAAIRHPMPYGDLRKQRVQRFAQHRGSPPPRVHDRGDGGVRAPHRRGDGGFRGALITPRSCARPSAKPT